MAPDRLPQGLMTFEEAISWWRDYQEHHRAMREEFETLFPALASRFPTLSGPGGPKPPPEQVAAAQAWLEAHPGARSRRCSFCAKTEAEIQRLIEGPGDVFICDECIEVCYDLCYDTIKARGGNASESQ